MRCWISLLFLLCSYNLQAAEPDWPAVRREASGILQQYLRLDTSNPPGDVRAAVSFLAGRLEREGIEFEIIPTPDSTRVHLLATLPGSDPALKPLLLMSHTDVVPADSTQWSQGPFSGTLRDGYIYGRGALDMKGMGVMELMVLMLLKREGWQPRRTLKMLAVADEETFGEYGCGWVVEHHWDKLDPEWVLDEGGIGMRNAFPNTVVFVVATAQKKTLWVDLVVEGTPGHGSSPYRGHPNEVLVQALERIIAWETPLQVNPVVDEALNRIGSSMGGLQGFILRHLDNPLVRLLAGAKVAGTSRSINALLRNTVSVTMLQSGYKINVIPGRAQASLDIRLLPETDPERFLEELKIKIADDRVQLIVPGWPRNEYTSDWNTPLFRALQHTLTKAIPEAVVAPFMTTGGTDSKWFQARGTNTYGVIPVLIDDVELGSMHGIDERIAVDNLLLGTRILYRVVRDVCP